MSAHEPPSDPPIPFTVVRYDDPGALPDGGGGPHEGDPFEDGADPLWLALCWLAWLLVLVGTAVAPALVVHLWKVLL